MSHYNIVNVIELFLLYCEGKKRKQDTINGYKAHLNQFAKWAGDRDITSITTVDIDQYRLSLVKRGLSDNTINSYLRSAKVLLTYAARRDIIAKCPTVEYIQVVNTPKPGLITHELSLLLDAARHEANPLLQQRAIALMALALTTGMRVSEITRAKMSKVIPVVVDGEPAAVLMVESAKSRPPRPAPLPASCWHEICRYRSMLPLDASDYMFLGCDGKQLTRRGVQHIFQRLQSRSGVEVSPHKFRRTFAGLWLSNSQGRELDTLKTIGGWSSEEIIKRHYADYDLTTLVRVSRRNSPSFMSEKSKV